tara:strand:- start:3673 stop:4716 length:1044 start_codon:yes stop_codon:yes gene_type:complete
MDKFIKDICLRIYKNCDVSDFKNKTILITGANGLIGGFIADFFHYLNVNHNYNIKIILTSLSENPERLKHLLDEDNVIYISKNLVEYDWSDFTENVDYCLYCAGYAQPSKFLSNAFETVSLNTTSLFRTFTNLFFNNKNAKAVFISSSEVYSLNDNSKPHEETDKLNVSLTHKRIPYILGKISGEHNVNSMRDLGYDVKSARVSLCYGPGHTLDDSRVMSDLTKKAMKNNVIELFDDGSSFRKYQHISDCCVMLFNILIRGKHGVYNIGGKEETTIYDLAKIIGNKFEKEVKKGKVNNDVITSAPKKVWVSLDRYEQEFESSDFMSLEDGMDNYLNWFINKFVKQKD